MKYVVPPRSAGEEFRLERVIFLRDEERGGAQSSLPLLLRRHLVVEQLLDVIDRKQMLSVHGDDDGIPDLRDQDLGLVLDFHVCSCQDLRVDALGKTREDVSPWRPDRNTE